MQRVMAYVDGFNLYFGLKDSGFLRFSQKRIVVAFPPSRYSNELKRCANGYLTMGEDKLRASQLPEQLVKPDGYVLARPASWR
ncbi:hypothetical protein [Candidatus Igneacidithiobacillus taiwanensis]|uniref:hypothetical protein n=1 Tax=Candidatus Igneacidithiobacillus taiwanensis TaxID=1945924 RepID=UPI002899AABB|nr:hypothetical protein [Candidatus Igneacidithiobacillus taiwanensis]